MKYMKPIGFPGRWDSATKPRARQSILPAGVYELPNPLSVPKDAKIVVKQGTTLISPKRETVTRPKCIGD